MQGRRQWVVFLMLGLIVRSGFLTAGERAIFVERRTATLRDVPDYAEKGRIVGTIKQNPGCKVEIMLPEAGVVQAITVGPGESQFRSALLEPASYTLRISADGWPMLAAPKITVEARYDRCVEVRFVERTGSKDGGKDDVSEAEREAEKKMPPPRPPSAAFDEGGLTDVDEAIKKDDTKKNKKDNKGKGNKKQKDKKKNRKKNKGKKKGKKGKKKGGRQL